MQDATTHKKVIADIPASVLLLEKAIARAVGITLGDRLHALAVRKSKRARNPKALKQA